MKTEIKIFGSRFHLLASLLLGVMLYLLIHPYAKELLPRDDEQLSLAASICFIGGLYAGRYISTIWTSGNRTGYQTHYIILTITIVACTSWLFFHADFPLNGRNGINLLLAALPFVILSLALGILIKLVRTSIKKKLQEANASAEQSRSELNLLQSQLSPHFLFNTLNNLYGISIAHHEKIPTLLLKLSDLLRYSVYDVKELFVPLKNELAYIKNYIDFEKLRIGERLMLNMDIEEIINTDIKIAPMMLIVFIENAFKHAKNSTKEKIQIDIALKTWGNSILFSIKNSYHNPEQANDENIINKHSGLGLENVNKRLELLYNGRHDLKVEKDDAFYTVMLQLKVK